MTVYISRNKNIVNLKEKLANLFNTNNLNFNVTLDSKSLRLWKLGMNLSSEDIKKFLTLKKEEINSDVNKLWDIPDISYLERNYFI